MSDQNKEVVRRINKGFQDGNDEAILDCLTDDVVWNVKGAFIAKGKEEFRKQITNDFADGPPKIDLIHMVADDHFVAVEGYVENKFKNGSLFKAFFHNSYHLQNGKINVMNSYVVPEKSFETMFDAK